jgi:DNA-binding MarR family transcriptional regulator
VATKRSTGKWHAPSRPAIGRRRQFRQVPDDAGVGQLIGEVRLSLLRAMDAGLREFGLTGAQLPILRKIADGSASTAADLCRSMHYDTGSMTRMVDRLEAKGLLRRTRGRTDRRVVHLRITRSGRELLPQLTGRGLAVIESHLAGFTPAEIDTLKGYLRRMLENG